MDTATTYEELKALFDTEKTVEAINHVLDRNYVTKDKESGYRLLESFWDYRDVNDFPDVVARVASETDFSEITSKEEAFWRLFEAVEADAENWLFEDEFVVFDNIIREIKSYFYDCDIELDIPYSDFRDFLEYEFDVVYESGLYDQFKDCELKVDIMLDAGDEWNADNTYITHCLEMLSDGIAGKLSQEEMDYCRECFNNAFTWLLHTDGLTWLDILNAGKDSKVDERGYLEEIGNHVSLMANVCLLVTVSVQDFCALVAKEGFFKVNTSARYFSLGFFDHCCGGGSLLGIRPDNFVLPASMVHRVIVEGCKSTFGYGVDDVYGLIAECWPSCLEATTVNSDTPSFPSDKEWTELCDELERLSLCSAA